MTPVRVAAARALLAVEDGRTTLAAALADARAEVADRDKALLVELAAGTLRWRNELDACIAAASRRSVTQIDPRALVVLRIATYQLRHLRIPPHAIVHESVDAVRALHAPRAAGFVNAVLRALQRRERTISLPKRPGADAHRDAKVAYLSVTLSHPAWLAARWLDRVGFEAAETWCRFNNTTPDVTVRPVHGMTHDDLLARLRAESIDATPAPYVADAIRLPPGALGRLSESLRANVIIQDEGAQLVARMAAARPGERVLDACASPGGKTIVMATDMRLDRLSRGTLVAADYRAGRVALLVETLNRAHVPAVIARLDAQRPLPFADVFDCVVLDAPCSGLGVVRRDPDLKWSRSPDDLPRFAGDQQAMLDACAGAVKRGGRLVYATCSSEPEENAAVVTSFLQSHTDFALAARDRTTAVPASLLTGEGWLATSPAAHGLEAFFAAVLVRRGAA
jgi:16S rRNA (cytosine967-C5)-methyltransferase